MLEWAISTRSCSVLQMKKVRKVQVQFQQPTHPLLVTKDHWLRRVQLRREHFSRSKIIPPWLRILRKYLEWIAHCNRLGCVGYGAFRERYPYNCASMVLNPHYPNLIFTLQTTTITGSSVEFRYKMENLCIFWGKNLTTNFSGVTSNTWWDWKWAVLVVNSYR